MEFESWVEAKGFTLADLSDEQRATLQAAWRAEQRPAPPPTPGNGGGTPDDFNRLMDSLRAEQDRERRITALVAAAAKDHPNQLDDLEAIGRQAINGKWTEQQAELALLRAARPSAPSPLARHGREASEAVVCAALARTAGMTSAEAERHYGGRTLEAADRQFRGGLSIGELVLSFARRQGYADASLKADLSRTLSFAFAEPAASVGPSQYSLSGILSNVANKMILDAFLAVEQEWRKLSAITPVRDFKEMTSYALTGDVDFKEIAAGGQLEHGTLGEESYANQAKSYGRLVAVDRRDLINDDLGAFNKARVRLGRGGATKLNKVFWTEWNRIADFNTALLGNFDDGADSVFAEDGVAAADLLFRAQTDPNGEPLGILPAILAVPPVNRVAALRLMNSQFAADGTAAGDANPWAGAFEVVSSQYMASTTYGGTATRWALAARPTDLPCIETCFLNGVEVPTVEAADMAPDRLGIILRAFYDFGVRRQEKRGRVVMAGA